MARKDEDKKDLEEQCPPCSDIVLFWPGAQLQFKSCQGKEMGREGRDGTGDRVDPAREEKDLPPLNGPQLCRVLERLGSQKTEAGLELSQRGSCRLYCS